MYSLVLGVCSLSSIVSAGADQAPGIILRVVDEYGVYGIRFVRAHGTVEEYRY
jgi:hypothetical protein